MLLVIVQSLPPVVFVTNLVHIFMHFPLSAGRLAWRCPLRIRNVRPFKFQLQAAVEQQLVTLTDRSAQREGIF